MHRGGGAGNDVCYEEVNAVVRSVELCYQKIDMRVTVLQLQVTSSVQRPFFPERVSAS